MTEPSVRQGNQYLYSPFLLTCHNDEAIWHISAVILLWAVAQIYEKLSLKRRDCKNG